MIDPIAGRVALVTGSARGIGRSIAIRLAEAGARVVLSDVDEGVLATTAGELRLPFERLDVRDPASWASVVGAIGAGIGPIELLVNNAGIMPIGSFLEAPHAVDQRQVDINVWGVYHGMRAVVPGMVARGRGHVVNIASAAGKAGIPHIATYSATKHAVVGLTEAVRYELRGTGVNFTIVLPSLVDTELISGTGRPRFVRPASCDEVAIATVHGVRAGKVDVYVPRIGRLTAVVPALLPRPIAERIGQLFGMDQMFARVDPQGRAAYVRRTG